MRLNIYFAYVKVDLFTYCTTLIYFVLSNHTFAYLRFYLKIIAILFTVDYFSFLQVIQHALRKVFFTSYSHKVNKSRIHPTNHTIIGRFISFCWSSLDLRFIFMHRTSYPGFKMNGLSGFISLWWMNLNLRHFRII